MPLLTLIGLIATVADAAKDFAQIAEALKAMGFKPGDIIPAEHMRKINDILATLPDAADESWQENHVSEAG